MAKRVLQQDGTYCYTENCKIHDRSGEADTTKLNAAQATVVGDLMMAKALSAPTLEDRFALMADWQAFNEENSKTIKFGETTDDKIQNFLEGKPDFEATKLNDRIYMLRRMVDEKSTVGNDEIVRFIQENDFSKATDNQLILIMRSSRLDIDDKYDLAQGAGDEGLFAFYVENTDQIEVHEEEALRVARERKQQAYRENDLWNRLGAHAKQAYTRGAVLDRARESYDGQSLLLSNLAINPSLSDEDASRLLNLAAERNSGQWRSITKNYKTGVERRRAAGIRLVHDDAFMARDDESLIPNRRLPQSWIYHNGVLRNIDARRIDELTIKAADAKKGYSGYDDSPWRYEYPSRYLSEAEGAEYNHLRAKLDAQDLRALEKESAKATREAKRKRITQTDLKSQELRARVSEAQDFIQTQNRYNRIRFVSELYVS